MRDFVNEEIEVLRAAGGPSGGPLPAHNRVGEDDKVLRRLVEGRARVARSWCINSTCKTNDDGSLSYCARGAVMTNGTWSGYDRTAMKAEKLLSMQMPEQYNSDPGESVALYNNGQSQAHIVALFDRAIAARKSALDPSRSL